MDMPIDLQRLTPPVKDKYLDEETPMLARWCMGAYSVDEKGAFLGYFVGSADTDVFKNVPVEKAQKLVQARDEFCDRVLNIINGAE